MRLRERGAHRGLLPEQREDRLQVDRSRRSGEAMDGGQRPLPNQLRLALDRGLQAWVERVEELASLGCRRRGLDDLRAEAPELAHLCDRLEEHEIPDSLVHGDLHHGNMVVLDDHVAVIDWSDAAIGQPFLDLAPVLMIGERRRDALVDAYVESWPGENVRKAAAIAEVLGCVYQAISYREINAAFEPDDRWLFADEHGRWMERAARLADALDTRV
jgi:aminoglycoside phosphotransferase (APT) family kinase protein